MRRVLSYTLVFTMLLAATWAFVTSTAQDQSARGFVESMLETMLAAEGRSVSIDGLNVSLSGNVSVDRVEVRDGETSWLALEGLRLNWQPLSLFRRTLVIDELSIETAEIIRLPKSEDAGVAAPREMRGLTNAQISRLKIGWFRIGEAVVGEAASLTVEGSAQIVAEPAEVRLQFKAERNDDKSGSLAATARLDPASRQLDVDLSLNEPRDGVVARALNLRGNPAVNLDLKANGTFDDWKGTFALDLDGEDTLKGEASIATHASLKRIDVVASGEVHRVAPPALSNILRGSSELIASLELPSSGNLLNIQRIWIDNDAYQLRVDGPADWFGSDSNVSLELRSKSPGETVKITAPDWIGPLEISGVSADFLLTGNLLAPTWAVEVSAGRAVSDIASIDSPRLRLSGTGASPSPGSVSIAGHAGGMTAQGRMSGLPDAYLGPLSADLSAVWVSAAAISIHEARISSGAVKLAAKGELGLQEGSFNLALEGEASLPWTGIKRLDDLLRGKSTFKGGLSTAGDGKYDFKSFALEGEGFRVTANGSATQADANLTLDLSIVELGFLDDRLAGGVEGRVSVTGAWKAPQMAVELTSPRLMLGGKPLAGARISANLVLSEHSPSGTIEGSAALEGRPVQLNAHIDTDATGTRHLRELEIVAGATRVAGELHVPRSGAPTGEFTLRSEDLRDLGSLLLVDLSGQLNADISLIGDGDGELRARFEGSELGLDVFGAREAKGEFRVASPFSSPRPEGQAAFREVVAGSMGFRSLAVNAAAGDPSTYDLTLKADGSDVSAEATLNVSMSGADFDASVSGFTGALRGIPLRAMSPFRMTRRGGALRLSDFAVSVGNGRVDIAGQVMPTLDAKVQLTTLNLAAFEQLAGVEGLKGTVSGFSQLKGDLAAPTGPFEIVGESVSVTELMTAGLEPVSFSGRGSLRQGNAEFTATGRSGSGTGFSARGTLGLSSSRSSDIRIEGRTDGKFLTAALAESGIRFVADSQFDLRVSGRNDSLSVSGGLNVSKGLIGDLQGRFLVRDARGKIAIADNIVRIESLVGVTGRNGTAEFSGSVGLAGDMPADVRAVVSKGIYTDGSLVTTRYDANLSLTGPLRGGPLLAGEIRLERTKITLAETPPRALPAPDVRHRHATPEIRRQAEQIARRASRGSGDIALNLLFVAADPISVTGRGLAVTLGGRLQLTGTLESPSATGAFRMQRGSLRLLARRLQFEDGRLDFDRGLDPRVHLEAVSRRSDATITLTISGRASEPDIRVTATPEMPQEEAMARLMFDRSMLQLSPLQIAQIASYVSTLSGGRDTGILNGLQNALGTDWLDIVQTETGETAVSIGKRINDRLSIGVEQTTKTNTSRVTIDLGLTRNLKARGSYATDGTSRAGIYFEKDY